MDIILGRAIITGIAVVVALPILYGLSAYLWNKKLKPRRMMRGQATSSFQNLVNRFMRFAFKEDTATLFPKSKNSALKKISKLSTLYLLSILVALVGFILTGLAYFFIPFGVLFLVAIGRANKVFNERYNLLSRMFAVANQAFAYGKNAEFDPWSWVNVTEWSNLTIPGKTVIKFPAKFRTDMAGSRESFEQHYTATVTDENIWTYEWDAPKGQVIVSPVKHLPTMAPYPGVGKYPWNVFIVGEGKDGPIYYDVMKTPHMLLGGSTGSGKSVLQRNIVFHCIQHNDRWRFLGVDLKRVELSGFNKYKRTVIGIGTDKEQGLGVVKYAFDQMNERYKMMEELGVNNFIDLEDPPYALLLMIDEAFMFLGLGGSKTDEGKAEDQMSGEASDLIGKLLRLGRAAGVFVVMATQRPDATVIKGEMKNNMDVRIAAGRMDSTPSSMILDSGAATQLPGHIKGRGVIRFTGAAQQFQGYFAEPEWIDNWLVEHPEVEPSTVEEGGHLHEAYMARKMQQTAAPTMDDLTGAPAVTADAPQGSAPKGKISMKDRFSFKAPAEQPEAPVQAPQMQAPQLPPVQPPAPQIVTQAPPEPVLMPAPVQTPQQPPAPVFQQPTTPQLNDSQLFDFEEATLEDPVKPNFGLPAAPPVTTPMPNFSNPPAQIQKPENFFEIDESLDFDDLEDVKPDEEEWKPVGLFPTAPPVTPTPQPAAPAHPFSLPAPAQEEAPKQEAPKPPAASPFNPKPSPFKPKAPENPFQL